MTHDIKRLEAKIKKFHETVIIIVEAPPTLIPIVHGPGWTSEAEYRLVEASLDSMQAQMDSVGQQMKSLVAAAKLVGASRIAAE
jgi:hypothetical protein